MMNVMAELHVPSGDDWVCSVTPKNKKRKPFRVGASKQATEEQVIWMVTDLCRRKGVGDFDFNLRRKYQVELGKIRTPKDFLGRYT